MHWVDTHCHLNEDVFQSDRTEVIRRSVEAGVSQMLVIGITRETSEQAVALAQEYPAVYAVVGIQPNYVATALPDDFAAIEALASQPKVVGIGETGLDRYWDRAPFPLQVEYFERHLALARALDLPFVVHCRDAEADVVAVLQRAAAAGPLSGVMHSFAGDAATARTCLDLGLHLSFSGMITYKRNEALRQTALEVPLDRILVETDAPYLSPSPLDRGRRNEPVNVKITANRLADLRGLVHADFAAATTANARRLFRLP